ncbi:MAG: N-acetylneuraminate synthase family protein [Planctomycetota bacterium]|nr:N-acetylneuraminate synthase family protein [Planctomycetota bacterium]
MISLAHSPSGLSFAPASADQPARVCVLAEIGVNHDGDVERAITLARDAARAGADAIKLQLFDPRHLLSNQARLAIYQEGKATDAFDLLAGLVLRPADMLRVRAEARLLGLGFVVTPFSLEDIPALAELEVDAVKIASPDAVNRPLLEAAAALGKPMLVSTGTAEADELGFVAKLLRRRPQGGCLLQCVSSYPTPLDQAALGGIVALTERFGLPVGYSDHTTDAVTGALATAAGACLVEKHITYDRAAKGPDHSASFDPVMFAEYVAGIRRAASMLGVRAKAVQPVEADVKSVSRQSLCAARDLKAGQRLRRVDLTVKRPGTGIPAADLRLVVGKTVTRDIATNNLLMLGDVA